MLEWLTVRALVGGRFVPALDLLGKLIRRDPRMSLSRLSGILDVYFRARLVPRWIKAGTRRFSRKNKKFRPPFAEMVP
jgi:hypothetical protein